MFGFGWVRVRHIGAVGSILGGGLAHKFHNISRAKRVLCVCARCAAYDIHSCIYTPHSSSSTQHSTEYIVGNTRTIGTRTHISHIMGQDS